MLDLLDFLVGIPSEKEMHAAARHLWRARAPVRPRGGATRATGLFLPVASSGARGRAMRAIVICVIVVYTLPRRAKRSESLACTRVTVLLGSDPAS